MDMTSYFTPYSRVCESSAVKLEVRYKYDASVTTQDDRHT
jgi:hypothetical protein